MMLLQNTKQLSDISTDESRFDSDAEIEKLRKELSDVTKTTVRY